VVTCSNSGDTYVPSRNDPILYIDTRGNYEVFAVEIIQDTTAVEEMSLTSHMVCTMREEKTKSIKEVS
jgi:hypothetical protein